MRYRTPYYSPSRIMHAVSAVTGVSIDDIQSKSRTVAIQHARQLFTAYCHDCQGHSYPNIAVAMGRTCHSGPHGSHDKFKQLPPLEQADALYAVAQELHKDVIDEERAAKQKQSEAWTEQYLATLPNAPRKARTA